MIEHFLGRLRHQHVVYGLVYLAVACLWFVLFARSTGPVAEFYGYTHSTPFGVYGSFWRPLSLNLWPKTMYGAFLSQPTPYYVAFALLFAAGFLALYVLVRESARAAFGAPGARWGALLAVLFVLSNVHVASAILVQFTITDFLFFTFYCGVLTVVVSMLRNRRIAPLGAAALVVLVVLACGAKEFSVLLPFVLLVAAAGRFENFLGVVRRQPRAAIALVLVIGAVFAIYAAILVTLPTYFHNLLSGQGTGDFKRSDSGQLWSNVGSVMIWSLQLPDTPNYPYVFNPLVLLKGADALLLRVFSVVLGVAVLAALAAKATRREALMHVALAALWAVFLSANERVVNPYVMPVLAHGGVLLALGASVLWRLVQARAGGTVENALSLAVVAATLALSVWTLDLSARTMHSPLREASFHGSMAAFDVRLRAHLQVLQALRTPIALDIDLADAPEEARFALATGGGSVLWEYFIVTNYAVTPDGRTLHALLTPHVVDPQAPCGNPCALRMTIEKTPVINYSLTLTPAAPAP